MNDNYLPLYRKYRPQCLEEIVGQEHIKKTLRSAIELNKISHAYLFTGPRGTGKTSFINMWSNKLRNEENTPFNIIQYNAWENDDAPNALIPISCSFCQLLGEDPNISNDRKTKIIRAVEIVGPQLISGMLYRLVGINTSELASAVSEAIRTSRSGTYDEKTETFRKLVKQFTDEDGVIIIEVLVNESDMGTVIGKGGAIANSIRTIVQAAAYVNGNVKVKINIDSFYNLYLFI